MLADLQASSIRSYMTWGSHMSNFHGVTQYGSKIRHASVTGVTCDTTCDRFDQGRVTQTNLCHDTIYIPPTQVMMVLDCPWMWIHKWESKVILLPWGVQKSFNNRPKSLILKTRLLLEEDSSLCWFDEGENWKKVIVWSYSWGLKICKHSSQTTNILFTKLT